MSSTNLQKGTSPSCLCARPDRLVMTVLRYVKCKNQVFTHTHTHKHPHTVCQTEFGMPQKTQSTTKLCNCRQHITNCSGRECKPRKRSFLTAASKRKEEMRARRCFIRHLSKTLEGERLQERCCPSRSLSNKRICQLENTLSNPLLLEICCLTLFSRGDRDITWMLCDPMRKGRQLLHATNSP